MHITTFEQAENIEGQVFKVFEYGTLRGIFQIAGVSRKMSIPSDKFLLESDGEASWILPNPSIEFEWVVNLPKWPAIVVVGDPISKEQAAEIIIRTNAWHYQCTNDKEWDRLVFEASNCPSWWEFMDMNLHEAIEKQEAFYESIGQLQLEYLHNMRIGSSYIGGPYGWCNWDGTIGINGKNIGKWPSISNVYDEWKKIARAFPYLNLRCQLFDKEYHEEDIQPVFEYSVKDGEVHMSIPTTSLIREVPSFDDMFDIFINNIEHPSRERGTDIETLKWALDLTKTRIKES